jgi:hypothetical protein
LNRERFGIFSQAISPTELGDHKVIVTPIHTSVSFLSTELSKEEKMTHGYADTRLRI